MEKLSEAMLYSTRESALTQPPAKDLGWILIQVQGMSQAFREPLDQQGVTASAYVQGLSDLDRPTLKAAFDRALRECKWFPRVAELREFAMEERERMAELRAGERAKLPDCPECDGMSLIISEEMKDGKKTQIARRCRKCSGGKVAA